MKQSYVYILTNWNNKVMYVGVTADLERRLVQHQRKEIEGFTKKYNINKLVHYEVFGDIAIAIQREKEIKAWRREKKDKLVQQNNPDWNDLSGEWYEDPSACGVRDDVRGKSIRDDGVVRCSDGEVRA